MKVFKVIFSIVSVLCILVVAFSYLIFYSIDGEVDSDDIDYAKLSSSEKIEVSSVAVLGAYGESLSGERIPKIVYVYKNDVVTKGEYSIGKELKAGVYFPRDEFDMADYILILYRDDPPVPFIKVRFSEELIPLDKAKNPMNILNYFL